MSASGANVGISGIKAKKRHGSVASSAAKKQARNIWQQWQQHNIRSGVSGVARKINMAAWHKYQHSAVGNSKQQYQMA